MNRDKTTDTNQASEGEIRETIERLLRFNCPNGCDGNGSYPEMGSDGEWEQGQCQWCFEYGMPARDVIQSLIRNEKLKLLAEVRERVVGLDSNPTVYDPDHVTFINLEDIKLTGQNEFRTKQRAILSAIEAKMEAEL